MQIHNFYSDILLSVRSLFDNYIFPSDLIKYYSFNIANRTFELSKRDYKPNYTLPAAVIRLEDERYTFGERPNIIHNQAVPNFNQIPVISDPGTKQTLYQQEEHITTNISVQINCESQFQAKEVEFQVKRFLPVEKYIQLFSFTSFLEIPRTVLTTLGMDFTDREIINLFTRFNKNLGEMEYCYSVNYEPLIRLNEASVNIGSSTQRSFSVSLGLEYMIQMPIWLCAYKEPGIIENIAIDFYRFAHEPISENSVRPLINPKTDDKYGTLGKVTKRNLLIHDWEDYNFGPETVSIDDKNYIRVGIQFLKDDFIIDPEYEFNIFDTIGRIHRNISPEEVNTDENYVTFLFEESEFSSNYEPSITSPVVLQFVEVRSQYY